MLRFVEDRVRVMDIHAFTDSSWPTSELRASSDVFVLKSKGKGGGIIPFARAKLLKPASGDRWLLRYGDGTTFRVRRRHIVPIVTSGVLACATTREYRLAARTQPMLGETCVEIGCDLGACCERLKAAVGSTGRVVGVDKAADRLALAKSRLPHVTFLECDVLRDPTLLAGLRPNVGCLDINGSRAYDAVKCAVDWILHHWNPRLLLVKSSNFLRTHAPLSFPQAGAPARLLREHCVSRPPSRNHLATIVRRILLFHRGQLPAPADLRRLLFRKLLRR